MCIYFAFNLKGGSKMKKSSNKGFTLVELIIVIAILAIIMLIAIPNFSGIQQRMQVRADKATAAQIGKAVRIWFTDYTTDPNLTGTVVPSSLKTPADADFALTEYGTLSGIESYVTPTYRASSLKDKDNKAYPDGGYYMVFLTANSTDAAAKIAIAITTSAPTKATVKGIAADNTVTVDYDGKLTDTVDGGVAYVEP